MPRHQGQTHMMAASTDTEAFAQLSNTFTFPDVSHVCDQHEAFSMWNKGCSSTSLALVPLVSIMSCCSFLNGKMAK